MLWGCGVSVVRQVWARGTSWLGFLCFPPGTPDSFLVPTVTEPGRFTLRFVRRLPACLQTFTRATTLRGHMQLHSNARKYKCPVCKKVYDGYDSKSHRLSSGPFARNVTPSLDTIKALFVRFRVCDEYDEPHCCLT